MVSSESKLASAVGGKSARACDHCIRKRARWYCAADDAFLCQSCDSSVHSANPLAERHQRVRLKTTSFKSFDDETRSKLPSWHRGFTRKARSPRQKKVAKLSFGNCSINNPLHLVPEICSEERSPKENEDQLLYQVPTFDPFVAELCTSGKSKDESLNNIQNDAETIRGSEREINATSDDFMNHVQGFLPSEMDLDEFAANVESLLGNGLEDESFDMEGLGLFDCDETEKESKEGSFFTTERVKLEDEEVGDDFEFNFDYDSPIPGEEDVKVQTNGEPVVMMMNSTGSCKEADEDSRKKISLRLDYDGVLSAWDDQKSPWTTGERPELDSGDCWLDYVDSCGSMHIYGGMGMMAAMTDRAREARVSRYREKRQKRLFSKKIRYEVRKVNAQKRPRMKGRFVKRANLVASASTLLKT